MENFQLNKTAGSEEFAWSVTFAIAGITAIAINTLALYTFTTTAVLRSRKHVMIINLTIADLLFGAFGMPSTVFYILKPSDVAFYVFFTFIMFSKMASLLTLSVIAVERMHAIVWPIRHRVLGNSIYKKAIGVIWALSAALTAIVTFNAAGNEIKTSALGVLLPIVMLGVITTIVACYITIWISVRRSGKQRKLSTSAIKQDKQDKSLAVTLLLVAGAFVVTWVIPKLYLSISRMCTSCYQPTATALECMHLVFEAQSVINPIIYCFRLPEFKKALKAKVQERNCLNDIRRQPTFGSEKTSVSRNEACDSFTAL